MVLSNGYPSFSVLMSVYKRDNPSYLDIALKSIEQQTVKPKEIVLVEDGPISKELRSIIEEHCSRSNIKFKKVKLKRNCGLGKALQIGTDHVSTKWIARMDSDDISVPRRFELQLNEIMKNPDLAVIGGQIKEFAGEPSNVVGYRRVPITEPMLRKFIKWRSPFNHPSVMLNKVILKKVGGYIPYGNLEDYYLWARVISNDFHVKNINQVLLNMRVDDGMYKRRGKISNIRYFYRLRNFMYMHNMLKWYEKIWGDWVMTLNILIPGWLRKYVYQHMLHKSK